MEEKKYVSIRSSLIKNLKFIFSLIKKRNLNYDYYQSVVKYEKGKEYKDLVIEALKENYYMFWGDYASAFQNTYFYRAPTQCSFRIKKDYVEAYSPLYRNTVKMEYSDFSQSAVRLVLDKKYEKKKREISNSISIIHNTFDSYKSLNLDNKELVNALDEFSNYTKDVHLETFNFNELIDRLVEIKNIIASSKSITGSANVVKVLNSILNSQYWSIANKQFNNSSENIFPLFFIDKVQFKTSEKEREQETILGKNIVKDCKKWISDYYQENLLDSDFSMINDEHTLMMIDDALKHLYIKQPYDDEMGWEKKSHEPFSKLFLSVYRGGKYWLCGIRPYKIEKIADYNFYYRNFVSLDND